MNMTTLIKEPLQRLSGSGIREFAQLAQKREGCISLTLGEPDFNTPDDIKGALKRALDSNLTHYAPNAGYDSLRKAIADYEHQKGVFYKSNEVIVTIGATEALFDALFAVIEPGDEVIVPVPAFSLYESIITMCDGKTVRLDTRESGFQIEEEQLRTAYSTRTKAVILNSPNNPTGTVYTEETLTCLHEFFKDKPVFIICDEVYSQLAFGTHRSLASCEDLKAQLIVVQSFSKPYAMTGFRAGYLLADRPIVEILEKVHQYNVVSIPSFVQAACEAALAFDYSTMRESYQRRTDYVCRRLSEMGLAVRPPDGGFYVFPSIAGLGMTSDAFCRRLIAEAGLALTPGNCFGGEGHVRISCCYAQEVLEEGMNRLERFVRSRGAF
ncbi:pyridoxal phosphate-dependent aminotransferase [Emergencia timonensis]|uniref:pyridoxal phosphate-dependent aminotransferase n=1 Tax=Emergencia timonensis TaxID=1776384 RepID=UPI00399BEA90